MSGLSATIYLSLFFLFLYLLGLAIRKVLFLRDKAQMKRETIAEGRAVAKVSEMGPGAVKKFWLICNQRRVDGFLVNYEGKFHAYVNRCRHMTTPLDFVRNQFFTEDGRALTCLTHGAIYEAESGVCTEGPCKGLSLYRLPVAVNEEEVLVACPEGDLSFLDD
jgi:nitrite reductase/ring-hydroxylating ferredoxin subunit